LPELVQGFPKLLAMLPERPLVLLEQQGVAASRLRRRY
jgi:hypothetical protein